MRGIVDVKKHAHLFPLRNFSFSFIFVYRSYAYITATVVTMVPHVLQVPISLHGKRQTNETENSVYCHELSIGALALCPLHHAQCQNVRAHIIRKTEQLSLVQILCVCSHFSFSLSCFSLFIMANKRYSFYFMVKVFSDEVAFVLALLIGSLLLRLPRKFVIICLAVAVAIVVYLAATVKSGCSVFVSV